MSLMNPANALRQARKAAGLTQRQLAGRTGVPQSTVARIESGAIDPRASTLNLLLRACGFELEVERELGQGVDRSLIQEMLGRSPRERVEYNVAAHKAVERLRSARTIAR